MSKKRNFPAIGWATLEAGRTLSARLFVLVFPANANDDRESAKWHGGDHVGVNLALNRQKHSKVVRSWRGWTDNIVNYDT